jgi:hypothetical protein
VGRDDELRDFLSGQFVKDAQKPRLSVALAGVCHVPIQPGSEIPSKVILILAFVGVIDNTGSCCHTVQHGCRADDR